MDDKEIFYLRPNTIYSQSVSPHRFGEVFLKSVYKYCLSENQIRVLIILSCNLESPGKNILREFRYQEYKFLEPFFSIDLSEVYISFLYKKDNNQILGPEYFLINQSDEKDNNNIFIVNHEYWNFKFQSDLNVTRDELKYFMVTKNEICVNLKTDKLTGEAILLDDDKKLIHISKETVILS
tara:strand:+ start:1963 stop:2505 length:543 start_codon:yes stop_codon:yes gene_type:complete